MESRIILIALYKKYNGNWRKIYDAILNKEDIDSKENERYVELAKRDASKYVTLLDENYPEPYKQVYHPPIVVKIPAKAKLRTHEVKVITTFENVIKVPAYGRAMAEDIVRKQYKSGLLDLFDGVLIDVSLK